MHERANNVKLMPQIENACMQDLGKFCVDNTAQDEVAHFISYDFVLFATFSFLQNIL